MTTYAYLIYIYIYIPQGESPWPSCTLIYRLSASGGKGGDSSKLQRRLDELKRELDDTKQKLLEKSESLLATMQKSHEVWCVVRVCG